MAAKKRINITIDEETLQLADRQARRQKISRSAFLRAAVRQAAKRGRGDGGGTRNGKDVDAWPGEDIVHAFRYPWEEKSQALWKKLRDRENERGG